MKKMFFICILFLLPISLFAGDYTFIGTNNASTDLISGTQTANTWLDVSGLSEQTASGFTTSSGTSVTSTNGGTYLVKYSVSFKATVSCDWTIAVDVNGTNYHEITRRIGSNQDVGNASGSGLLSLSASDVVKLEVSPSIDATNFTPVDVQLVLVEVKETTSSPEYASMSINSTATPTIGTGYTTITNFAVNDKSTNWTHSAGVLTCNNADAAGDYFVAFSLSADPGGAAANLTDIGISVNDGDPSSILTQRHFGRSDDVGNVSGCGIVSLSNTNTIRLKAKAAVSKSYSIFFANVTLVKLTDTGDAPYASMNIESLTGVINVGTGWTKVATGLANDVTDGTFWSFSDNSLKPVGVSGGYYLVNYYYSLTGGSTSSETIFIDGTIGVQNTEQLDLAIKRKIDKNDGDDIGAAAGTGIIYIDDAADDISMLLRTPDGTSDLKVRKANLSIFRVDKASQDQSLPVDLTSFTATQKNNTVILEWQTASETNNQGFNIERKDINNEYRLLASYLNNKELEGAGSKSSSTDYKFIDKNIISGGIYEYRISSVDYSGKVERLKTISIDFETLDNSSDIPNDYALKQAYPNPFNPTTTISYNIPKSSFVKISIFDINGNTVDKLVNAHKNAGFYTVQWNASHYSSGIYFYRMTSGNFVSTKKIVLIR